MNLSSDSAALAAEFRTVLLEGAEEVLGLDEARGLFERAQAFATREAGAGITRELVYIHELMEKEYGLPAAQGLALRFGRAGFRRGLKRWGGETGLLEPSFRFLPSGTRIYTGLSRIAASLSEKTGMGVAVGKTDLQWTMRVDRSPVQDAPLCHLIAGTLQEFLTWAGSGRVYRVREVECSTHGAQTCLFAIDMKPLD